MGWPSATSCAKLGPDSAPTGIVSPAVFSAITCVMRRSVPFSTPLVALTTIWPARMCGIRRDSVERRNSEGITETMMSAGATAALSPVTVMAGGSLKPGRNCTFSPASTISFAASGLCAQMVTGRPLRDSERASAVPQAPEPSTTILGAMGRMVMRSWRLRNDARCRPAGGGYWDGA